MIDKPDKRKVGESIKAINDTVYRIYLFVVYGINLIPAIALFIITFWVLFNFSWWNVFLGLIYVIGISMASNLLSLALMFSLSYALDRIEKNNESMGNERKITKQDILDNILKLYKEYKGNENFRSLFEGRVLGFIGKYSHKPIDKNYIRQELSRIAAYCKVHRLGAKEYISEIFNFCSNQILNSNNSLDISQNYKQVLRQEARSVDSLLTEYIKLHDSILKDSGSFLSVIKNVFIPIDYEKILDNTKELLYDLNKKKERLRILEYSIGDSLTNNQLRYLNQLLIFTEKLCDTCELLKDRQELLYKKSQGEGISKKDFYSVQSKYQRSMLDYKHEGERLNKLNPIIFIPD